MNKNLWTENDFRRGFMAGAIWLSRTMSGEILPQSLSDLAEQEAERRYEEVVNRFCQNCHTEWRFHNSQVCSSKTIEVQNK